MQRAREEASRWKDQQEQKPRRGSKKGNVVGTAHFPAGSGDPRMGSPLFTSRDEGWGPWTESSPSGSPLLGPAPGLPGALSTGEGHREARHHLGELERSRKGQAAGKEGEAR